MAPGGVQLQALLLALAVPGTRPSPGVSEALELASSVAGELGLGVVHSVAHRTAPLPDDRLLAGLAEALGRSLIDVARYQVVVPIDAAVGEGDQEGVLHLVHQDPELLKNRPQFGNSGELMALVPEEEWDWKRTRLRLDSHLYSYAPLAAGETGALEVFESYAVKGGPRIRRGVGRMSGRAFVRTAPESVWDRRADLAGAEFTNICSNYNPICFASGGSRDIGFLPDLMGIIAAEANFTVRNLPNPNYSIDFGTRLEDGTHTGMAGMLRRGEVDLSLAGLYRTPDRDLVLDFAYDAVKDLLTLNMRADGAVRVNVAVFFETLNPECWLLVLVAALALATGLWANKSVGGASERSFKAQHGLALVFVVFLQRDYPFCKSALSTRVLFLTVCYLAFVLFSYFSAVLTSDMISRRRPPVVEDFRSFLDQGFRLATWRGGAQEEFFAGSPPGSVEREVYDRLLRGNPSAYYGSMREADRMLMSDPRLATFESAIGHHVVARPPGSVASLTDFSGSFTYSISVALPKGSELTALVRHHQVKLEQLGLTRKLRLRWGLEVLQPGTAPPDPPQAAEAYGYDNLAFPFLALLAGGAIAGLLAARERLPKVILPNRKATVFRG